MLTRILFSFLAIFAALVGGAYFLPKTVEVERSAYIAASQDQIFPYLNNLRAFNEWSPWAARDPRTVFTFTGPEEGVGASMIWHSEDPGVGAGRQEIVESIGRDRVLVALDFGERGWALSSYELTPKAAGTEVTWSFETDLGYNPLNRYLGLFFEHWVGSDYELGLKNLKIVTEKRQSSVSQGSETAAIHPGAAAGGRYADDMGADEAWLEEAQVPVVRHAADDYADDMGADEAWLASGPQQADPRFASDRDVADADEPVVVHRRAAVGAEPHFRLEIGGEPPAYKGRSLADSFWVLPAIRTEADLDAELAAEVTGGSRIARVHEGASLADSFWVLPSIRTEADLDAAIAAERQAVSFGRDFADDMGTEIDEIFGLTVHAPLPFKGRVDAHYADDMGVEIE